MNNNNNNNNDDDDSDFDRIERPEMVYKTPKRLGNILLDQYNFNIRKQILQNQVCRLCSVSKRISNENFVFCGRDKEHGFHSECLKKYWRELQQDDEEETRPCPVCKNDMSLFVDSKGKQIRTAHDFVTSDTWSVTVRPENNNQQLFPTLFRVDHRALYPKIFRIAEKLQHNDSSEAINDAPFLMFNGNETLKNRFVKKLLDLSVDDDVLFVFHDCKPVFSFASRLDTLRSTRHFFTFTNTNKMLNNQIQRHVLDEIRLSNYNRTRRRPIQFIVQPNFYFETCLFLFDFVDDVNLKMDMIAKVLDLFMFTSNDDDTSPVVEQRQDDYDEDVYNATKLTINVQNNNDEVNNNNNIERAKIIFQSILINNADVFSNSIESIVSSTRMIKKLAALKTCFIVCFYLRTLNWHLHMFSKLFPESPLTRHGTHALSKFLFTRLNDSFNVRKPKVIDGKIVFTRHMFEILLNKSLGIFSANIHLYHNLFYGGLNARLPKLNRKMIIFSFEEETRPERSTGGQNDERIVGISTRERWLLKKIENETLENRGMNAETLMMRTDLENIYEKNSRNNFDLASQLWFFFKIKQPSAEQYFLTVPFEEENQRPTYSLRDRKAFYEDDSVRSVVKRARDANDDGNSVPAKRSRPPRQ